jgi:hypothetical protein
MARQGRPRREGHLRPKSIEGGDIPAVHVDLRPSRCSARSTASALAPWERLTPGKDGRRQATIWADVSLPLHELGLQFVADKARHLRPLVECSYSSTNDDSFAGGWRI